MPILHTERLVLVPLSHAVISRRLEQSTFRLLIADVGPVTFPPSWPGDALGMFGEMLKSGADPIEGSFVAIERRQLLAVGMLGSLGDHGAEEVEIGYGFGVEGQGYATEAVPALVRLLLDRHEVQRIVAESAADNAPSIRVLEKCGFHRTGTSYSADDGDLVTWRWQG